MITYDSFEPGATMGEVSATVDEALIDNWIALFETDKECLPNMPEGMMAVLVMNAYTELLQPRPEGNIHASQEFEIIQFPQIGDAITTTLRCVGKEKRKGRGWVFLETDTRGRDGNTLFKGRMCVIWAK